MCAKPGNGTVGLEGRQSEQGVAAPRISRSVVHVEMSRSARDDRDRVSHVVRVLASTDFPAGR
jgi:hypothetical protein